VGPCQGVPGRRARSLARRAVVAVLLASALAVAACGESSAEKATKQVCSATSEISAQIKKLESLPISSKFVTEAKASVEAIEKSIKQINEAAPNLPEARKNEINTADKTFQSEIAKVTKQVVTASKSSNVETALKSAEPQIKASLNTLSASYKKAFKELKCS
jgi:formate-dependent nitrite reductase cytochrome c552 subunit